jgi:hypothetical protein
MTSRHGRAILDAMRVTTGFLFIRPRLETGVETVVAAMAR